MITRKEHKQRARARRLALEAARRAQARRKRRLALVAALATVLVVLGGAVAVTESGAAGL